MTKDKEMQTVKSVMKGDRSAMADLYRRHVGYLSAACSRYVRDDDAVKDILQGSFLKIFSSISRFEYRGPGSLRAWMTRIAVNEALDYLRSHEKTRKIYEDVPELPDMAEEEPETSDVPAAVIHEMIRNLPDGYRTVFNMYVFEEKSHREIAAALGITESTSASQFHRAKALLAARLKEYRKKLV